jgi:hypothetical protein
MTRKRRKEARPIKPVETTETIEVASQDPRPTPHPSPARSARPRERATLVPEFDPVELAKELESAPSRPTVQPPFDPASYARIVDANLAVASEQRDTPRTLTAATPASPEVPESDAEDHALEAATESIGRAMYGSYLESDFPEALVLAERVLEREPLHALAQLVAEKCRERLAPPEPALKPSSVLRLRAQSDVHALRLDPQSEVVLYHVDGFLDAATVAELAGIPRAEALDRLHALLDLGVLEVVSA